MKKRITIGTLTLLSLMGMFGCKQQETVEALMTLDVKADYPEKEWVVQDFLDVEYIPLETNDEFITQGSVKAIGKRFVLVTNLLNDGNIFVFDRKTGKAVRKINRKGQGAEEYAFINGIILDEEKDEMFVNSASNKKIFVYDLQGNFKRSFQHAEGAQYLDVFDYDADNLICYDMSASYKDGQKRDKEFYHALISKQDGSVTRAIPLPFDIIKAPFVQKGDMVAVASVRSITPDQGNWLLADTSSDMFLTMGVNTGRYCFMQTIGKEFNFEKGRGFPTTDLMYDSREKAVFKPIVLNANYTTRKRVDLISRLGNEEVAAYEILSADRLVEAYGKGELKGGLKEIAAGLDEESNPVLMLVKHKR